MTLTLQFEGSDPEALKAIATKSDRPRRIQRASKQDQAYKGMTEEEMETEARKQSPNWRDAPVRDEAPAAGKNADTKKPSANDDEIVLKPQPAADPAAPSTTAPPEPLYMRSVTLGLKGRSAPDIWKWFQYRTKCEELPTSSEDEATQVNLAEFNVQAEQDRQRVKAGVDAMRREKEDLRRAREAADRLTAES